MEWERIRKRPEDCTGTNLLDYERFTKTFSWAEARALLDGSAKRRTQHRARGVDRHVRAGRGDKLALRWIGRDEHSARLSPMQRLALL